MPSNTRTTKPTTKPTTKRATTPKAAPDAPAIVDLAALKAAAQASFAKLHAAHGGSIAIKPVADFKPVPITATFAGTNVTARACATVSAAFIANGVKLADGATTSRKFTTPDGVFVLENGGLKRAVLCGLVTVDNTKSTLTLRPGATKAIRELIGSSLPRGA